MPLVDVLRPCATQSAGNWALVGSSVHAALSDDSDSTYVWTDNNNLPWSDVVVWIATHTPSGGRRRHRFRIRARLASPSDVGGSVGVQGVRSSSGYINLASATTLVAPPNSGYALLSSSWRASAQLPTTGELTCGSGLVARLIPPSRLGGLGGGSPVQPEIRVSELFFDIDTRLPPAFTAKVYDAAGVDRSSGTVADTTVPRLAFEAVDLDGLNLRDWHVAIYDTATTMLPGFNPFASGFTALAQGGLPIQGSSGGAVPVGPILYKVPLESGTYVAYFRIRTNVGGGNEPFPTVASVAFTLDPNLPDAPDVSVELVPSPPAVDVCWSYPGGSPSSPESPSSPGGGVQWDDPNALVVEVQRRNCGEEEWTTIQSVQQGDPDGCWRDRFMPLVDSDIFLCDSPSAVPCVEYRVRYWGLADGFIFTSDWSTVEVISVPNPTPGSGWLRHPVDGHLDLAICAHHPYQRIRPFGVTQPIGGGIPTVVTGTPGGQNYTLTAHTLDQATQAKLEALVAAPLVFWQPVRAPDSWQAPGPTTDVTPVRVHDGRMTQIPMVQVNPEPIAPPESFLTETGPEPPPEEE